MSSLGFPSDAEIVFQAPENSVQLPEEKQVEPTNAELVLSANGGIDPWLLEGDNASCALYNYYLHGDAQRGESVSDVLCDVKVIGQLALLATDDSLAVSEQLSDNEIFLLDQTTQFTYQDAHQHTNWEQFNTQQWPESSPRPLLTRGQRWRGAIASILASSGLTPALVAMPQLAQFGMTGFALAGVGVGIPVAKAAWENANVRREEARAEDAAEEVLLGHGDDLINLLDKTTQKLQAAESVFIPDIDIKINLNDLKKGLGPKNKHHEKAIKNQIKTIDPSTPDEEYEMQEATWGPAFDMLDRAADRGLGAITKDDIDQALAAISQGRKNRKNRKYTLVFNPADAVCNMLEGIHGTHPEYLLRAWNGDQKPGIKQYVQNITKLQSELDRADIKTAQIISINDGLQNDRQADKITKKRYAAIRAEREVALGVGILELIKFSDAVTQYLLSGVFNQPVKRQEQAWEQPKQS